MTWTSDEVPEPTAPGLTGWFLAAIRGVPLILFIAVCLLLLLVVRLIEGPLFGLRRPWTPYITQTVCRVGFLCLGMGYRTEGTALHEACTVVANHTSWLDIFALNAGQRITFVAKSEVAGWPGIGWLARATGTYFVKRERAEAARQVQEMRDRIAAGQQLLFFPEGTSTDGLQVLAFKPTLFAALFDPAMPPDHQVQPVTLRYSAPKGADPRHYGWWGDMALAPHLISTLVSRPQGHVTVIYHPAVRVGDFPDRKALAAALQARVAEGLSLPASEHNRT